MNLFQYSSDIHFVLNLYACFVPHLCPAEVILTMHHGYSQESTFWLCAMLGQAMRWCQSIKKQKGWGLGKDVHCSRSFQRMLSKYLHVIDVRGLFGVVQQCSVLCVGILKSETWCTMVQILVLIMSWLELHSSIVFWPRMFSTKDTRYYCFDVLCCNLVVLEITKAPLQFQDHGQLLCVISNAEVSPQSQPMLLSVW